MVEYNTLWKVSSLDKLYRRNGIPHIVISVKESGLHGKTLCGIQLKGDTNHGWHTLVEFKKYGCKRCIRSLDKYDNEYSG